MTEAPKDDGVALTIIDTWKVKLPSIYLALPPDFINHVGGIVVAWGMFETAFQDFLTAMVNQSRTAHKSWQFLSFEQRLGRFDEELRTCFATAPVVFGQLAALSADAASLQIQRNLLVHGRLSLKIAPEGASLIADGRYKKQDISETYSSDRINDLYYAILHLGGRMAQFVRPDWMKFDPPLPSPEISVLRDVLSKNPTPRSTLTTLSRPPRPSEA